MKKKIILAALGALLFGSNALAQDKRAISDTTFTTQELGKYRITLQPLQLLVHEASINVERLWGRRSFGILAAYKPKGGREFTPDVYDDTYPGDEFKGITLGVNSKYYFSKTKRWFYEGQLFYRDWLRTYDYAHYNTQAQFIEYDMSQKFRVYGLKVLLGYSTTFVHSGRVRPLLTLYTGAGFRARQEHHLQAYKVDGVPDPAYDKKEWKALPSVHLGLTLGVEIFDKAISKPE